MSGRTVNLLWGWTNLWYLEDSSSVLCFLPMIGWSSLWIAIFCVIFLQAILVYNLHEYKWQMLWIRFLSNCRNVILMSHHANNVLKINALIVQTADLWLCRLRVWMLHCHRQQPHSESTIVRGPQFISLSH